VLEKEVREMHLELNFPKLDPPLRVNNGFLLDVIF
jgi:hypothetical protein